MQNIISRHWNPFNHFNSPIFSKPFLIFTRSFETSSFVAHTYTKQASSHTFKYFLSYARLNTPHRKKSRKIKEVEKRELQKKTSKRIMIVSIKNGTDVIVCDGAHKHECGHGHKGSKIERQAYCRLFMCCVTNICCANLIQL